MSKEGNNVPSQRHRRGSTEDDSYTAIDVGQDVFHGATPATGSAASTADPLLSALGELSTGLSAAAVATNDTSDNEDASSWSSSSSDCSFSDSSWYSAVPDRQYASWNQLRRGANIVDVRRRKEYGLKFSEKQNRQVFDRTVLKRLKRYRIGYRGYPFPRKGVTVMSWHPLSGNVLAMSSSDGDLVLWKVNGEQTPQITDMGTATGNFVFAMKFLPPKFGSLVTSTSTSGLVMRDMESNKHYIIYNNATTSEASIQHTVYTWIDASSSLIAAGGINGNLMLLSANDGTKIYSADLQVRINHVEFSPKDDYILCAASGSKVLMWDIRNMSKSLLELDHENTVNSACFSRTNGCRLLVTESSETMHVYRGPDWPLERTIYHGHTARQRFVCVKASWNPLVDVALVGGKTSDIPDECNCNHLDEVGLYSVDNNVWNWSLVDRKSMGNSFQSHFNPTGEYIATDNERNIIIWKERLVDC